MEHHTRVPYLPESPSTPQTKPARSPSSSPPSPKHFKLFSFSIPPFPRRSRSPPSPAAAAARISETSERAGRAGGRGWTFPLRIKSRKGRDEEEQEEQGKGEREQGKEGDPERRRRSASAREAGDIVLVPREEQRQPWQSNSARYQRRGETSGRSRTEPLYTPGLRAPTAEQQQLGRSAPPPSSAPRHEFPFPIVPPTSTTHSPLQPPTRFSPTSSGASTPRLLPRTRPTPLQPISAPLRLVTPPALHPSPLHTHLYSPSAPSQTLALPPQSRFTETLGRPSPLFLPAPTYPRRPPSPLQLERAPSSSESSVSPSIQLPAYYEFPRRAPMRPYVEHPVSRFSDWTSTDDSIDSPWDEPYGSVGGSRRASLGTGGSSGADRMSSRYSAQVLGESDGDADGEENGEETTDESSREMGRRGRSRYRQAHSHNGSSRLHHRRVDSSKPRMISTATQTTEDLLHFYDATLPPTPSKQLDSAPSTSSSQQPHRRAPPPPPSPSSLLLRQPTSTSSLRRPPAHSQSSSSAATFCTSTADTSVQGLEFPLGAEGVKPLAPPLSPVEESRSRRESGAGLEGKDVTMFRKRMSALVEWVGGTKAQKEARRNSVA